jgi:hypothetical protein
MEPSVFISEYLFDCVPILFSGDRELYISWKSILAKKLEVDSANILLVGSSAIGISLNPKNGFNSFNDQSDIDVAVISHYHFTIAWHYLRSQGHRRYQLDRATQTAWQDHVDRFIYWGTIATDRLLGILPFGKEWLAATSHMSTIVPTQGRDVRFRIYSDYESLRAYQIHSASNSRQELFLGDSENAEIS